MLRLVMIASLLGLTAGIGSTYTWSQNNNFLEPTNWESGSLPASGSVLMFPESNSNFNAEAGAGYFVAGDWEVSEFTFGDNSEFIIDIDVTIDFIPDLVEPPIAMWREKELHEVDYKCHANWLLASGKAPTKPPCHTDNVVFPAGEVTQVYVEQHAYADSVQYDDVTFTDTDALALVMNKHEFAGANVNLDRRSCKPGLDGLVAVGDDPCSRYCVDSCIDQRADLTPLDMAKEKLAIIEAEAAFFDRVLEFFDRFGEVEDSFLANLETSRPVSAAFKSESGPVGPTKALISYKCAEGDDICTSSKALSLSYSGTFNLFNDTTMGPLRSMSVEEAQKFCTRIVPTHNETYFDSVDQFMASIKALANTETPEAFFCHIFASPDGQDMLEAMYLKIADEAIQAQLPALFQNYPVEVTFETEVVLVTSDSLIRDFSVRVSPLLKSYEPFTTVYSKQLFDLILGEPVEAIVGNKLLDQIAGFCSGDCLYAFNLQIDAVEFTQISTAVMEESVTAFQRYGSISNPTTVTFSTDDKKMNLVLKVPTSARGSDPLDFVWKSDDHVKFDNYKGSHIANHQELFDQYFREEAQKFFLGTVNHASVEYTGPLVPGQAGLLDLAGYKAMVQVEVAKIILVNANAMFGAGEKQAKYSLDVAFSRALARITSLGLEAEIAAANQAINRLTPTSAPQVEAASDGGLPIVPIAAAGAGAAVLIAIIVVVVVMRRRGDREPRAPRVKQPTADRTVVAFENPMYDDPSQGAPAAVYDNGAEVDEGLYDEPAFNNAAEKANPMYQSNEDLAGAGAEEEEEGGYLDVAPEDEVE